MICIRHQILSGAEQNEMDRACSTYGGGGGGEEIHTGFLWGNLRKKTT